MDLIALLREFGTDDDLIALCERWVNRADDGVDPLTDDEIETMRAALTALADDDEVALPLLEAAADMVVALREEVETRTEEAAAEEAAIEAQRARLRGDDPEANADADGGDGGDEAGDADGDAGDAAPAAAPDAGDAGSDDDETEDADAAADQVPVTAAARRAPRQAIARRVPRTAQPPTIEPDAAFLTFSADVPNVPAGSRLPATVSSFHEVDAALERRYESFRRSRGNGGVEFIPVATLNARFPAERRLIDTTGIMLSTGDAGRVVGEIIGRQGTPTAIAAAGGLCAPLQPYYGVEIIGDDRRPVRDEALVGFQAARGGVITIEPPLLPATTGAVGVWTLDDDVAALDNDGGVDDVTKAILRIPCADTRESTIYAITLRLLVGNIIARTHSEWTQAWTDLTMVAHARIAEQRLLALIKTASTVLTLQTTQVSATLDVLNYVARAAASIRSRRRTLRAFPFRVILPEVFLDIAKEDLSKRMPGGASNLENLSVAEGMIMGWFADRNLNVTFSPDLNVMAGEQGATALSNYPPTIDFAIYPEGTFLHLDAGTLDLGVVRDTTTNKVNDFETFSESFEGVHLLGQDPLWGTINVCPSGAVSGTLDPEAVCASYT